MSRSAAPLAVGVSTNADMIDGDLGRFSEQLRLVADSGAEYAEIILHALDLVVDGRLDGARLAEVKRITSSFGLGYTIHLPFVLNLLDPERLDSYLAVFRSGLRLASELGCPAVVYHASQARVDPASIERVHAPRLGTRDPASIAAALFEEDAERLAALAEEARALGTRIGVENPLIYDLAGIATYGCEPAALAAQVARVGHPSLGATLDFGHLYLSSRILGYDYLSAVGTLAPLAVHAHLHDNFGKRDAGEPYIQRLPYGLGDLHLPPGSGIVPFDRALPVLLDSGYAGVLMLEIEFRMAAGFPGHVAEFRRRAAAARS